MIDIWKIINYVFCFIGYLASVVVITKTDWNALEPLDRLVTLGSIGGLIFLGEYFSEIASEDDLHKKKSTSDYLKVPTEVKFKKRNGEVITLKAKRITPKKKKENKK